MRAHGATVELIPGSRQDTADAAIARAETVFYASHNWHPFFLHGTKTLAYELWEDLGFRAPDNVIVPCGAGSNVLGCEIGFSELMRAGEIERLPRIFAAQPANCAPIARAFQRRAARRRPRPPSPKAPRSRSPVRLPEVLGALTESRGGAVMLTEAEIARGDDGTRAAWASMSSRPPPRSPPRSASCWDRARSRRSRRRCWC